MPYYDHDTIIYHNGNFVKAADAKMDFYSQSLHYGYGVFEGIRSYKTERGETKIFKATEHFDRLQRSAQALNMPYTWTTEALIKATYEVLRQSNLQDAYIRPLVYAPANMTFSTNTESFIVIEAWKMQPFLGDKLLQVMTSSFQRPNPKGFKIEAKATGHYVNSMLASQEAKAAGFNEALLLDMNDYVAEAPGANVFVERNNVLYTPKAGNILPGITRATVFEICDQLGFQVEQGNLTLKDMHGADSAFFCGTAAEVIGIDALDQVAFTKPWPETMGAAIQAAYKDLVIEKAHSTQLQPA